MRVCTVIAGRHGFRETSANQARLALGSDVLTWAGANTAALVVFPAGYLRCRRGAVDGVALNAAMPLVSAAQAAGCALVVGVDACSRGWHGRKGGLDHHVRAEQLPFFCVTAAATGQALEFRQRSTTGRDYALAPDAPNHVAHSLAVAGQRVGVALCGEGFSRPIRRALLAPETAVSLVVLPAHSAARMRQHNALTAFAKGSVSAVRAVHAHHGAENHLWRDDGRHEAVCTQWFTNGDLWAEASVFDTHQTRHA